MGVELAFRIQGRGRPDVILDFVFQRGLLFLNINNIGGAPAYKVSVTFNHDIRGVEGSKPIVDMALFRELEFLPPGREISTFMDSTASYFRQKQPSQIETRIEYHDRRRRRYTNTINHNLDIYRDIGYAR